MHNELKDFGGSGLSLFWSTILTTIKENEENYEKLQSVGKRPCSDVNQVLSAYKTNMLQLQKVKTSHSISWWGFLSPMPGPILENHPLSTVCNCNYSFNILAAAPLLYTYKDNKHAVHHSCIPELWYIRDSPWSPLSEWYVVSVGSRQHQRHRAAAPFGTVGFLQCYKHL